MINATYIESIFASCPEGYSPVATTRLSEALHIINPKSEHEKPHFIICAFDEKTNTFAWLTYERLNKLVAHNGLSLFTSDEEVVIAASSEADELIDPVVGHLWSKLQDRKLGEFSNDEQAKIAHMVSEISSLRAENLELREALSVLRFENSVQRDQVAASKQEPARQSPADANDSTMQGCNCPACIAGRNNTKESKVGLSDLPDTGELLSLIITTMRRIAENRLK